jgi:hypothetical protein
MHPGFVAFGIGSFTLSDDGFAGPLNNVPAARTVQSRISEFDWADCSTVRTHAAYYSPERQCDIDVGGLPWFRRSES